jgi:hypothetical protein
MFTTVRNWFTRPFKMQRVDRLLQRHLGGKVADYVFISEHYGFETFPDVTRAFDKLCEDAGYARQQYGYSATGDLREAVARNDGWMGTEKRTEPCHYWAFELSPDESIPCCANGLFLLSDGDAAFVALVRASGGPATHLRMIGALSEGASLSVEVIVVGEDRAYLDAFLARLRQSVYRDSVFRGRVLSFTKAANTLFLKVHTLPSTERHHIILPNELLATIERATLEFSNHSERLRRAGRHLKRGILLHGPPGTGKTLTAMYLANRMQDRTVILLTGEALGHIERSVELARLLQPTTIVVEDVDLIAEDRTNNAPTQQVLLFELLNQMDGLAEDADVLFLLTTNRPELLEPALAARPGRVDQAIEILLPDAECRARLVDLYGEGLTLVDVDTTDLVQRTNGVSAAFIRELLRRAALFAAIEQADEIRVHGRHIEAALRELLDLGGPLTRKLLGAARIGLV